MIAVSYVHDVSLMLRIGTSCTCDMWRRTCLLSRAITYQNRITTSIPRNRNVQLTQSRACFPSPIGRLSPIASRHRRFMIFPKDIRARAPNSRTAIGNGRSQTKLPPTHTWKRALTARLTGGISRGPTTYVLMA